MAIGAELYENTRRLTPTWLKELVRRYTTRVGCTIGRLPGVESLSVHLLDIFDRLKINCVLDVGAHLGEYGRFLRNIGYDGHIVSFEPILTNFAILQQHCARDRNWTALRLALGNREGVGRINVSHATQCSSFLLPNRYSLDQFRGLSEVGSTEMVEMKRLDSIFDACASGVRDARVFLKLDTQGYDLYVLEGAGPYMDRVLALQSELSVQPIYEGMTGYIAAMSYLNRMGYELTGVFPVTRDDHLRIIEFDGVLIRSSSSVTETPCQPTTPSTEC